MKLVIEDDAGRKTVVPFAQDEISIGRDSGNTVRLTERNVSRRHAVLVREDDSVLVEDLDSSNGVRVNGERIHGRLKVKRGDLIQIGDYDLALEDETKAALPDRPTQPNLTPVPDHLGSDSHRRSTSLLGAPPRPSPAFKRPRPFRRSSPRAIRAPGVHPRKRRLAAERSSGRPTFTSSHPGPSSSWRPSNGASGSSSGRSLALPRSSRPSSASAFCGPRRRSRPVEPTHVTPWSNTMSRQPRPPSFQRLRHPQ